MAVFVADEQARSVDLARLRRLASHVLASQRVPAAMELNVLCVDAGAMTDLNRHHMGGTGPTDVLAFPMDLPGETTRGPAILGDVVLCPEVAATQAPAHGVTYDAEMELLLVHGILHLLGFDHDEEAAKAEMFGLTDRLLAEFRAGDAAGGGSHAAGDAAGGSGAATAGEPGAAGREAGP